MHIAIFIPALYGGGAEKTMLKLSTGLSSQGKQVDLVLGRATGPYLSSVPDQVRLIDLKTHRDLFTVLPLARYLNKEQPDILLSGLHTNIIAILAKGLSKAKTRVAVSERNTFSIRSKQYSSDIRMKMMPTLVRYFYPKADYIIAVSNGVAEDLTNVLNLPKNKIHVIYNPVITPETQKKIEHSLHHPWFNKGEPPVILGVGRLTAQKDFRSLIKAFALLRKHHPSRLIILGEGEERKNLEDLISDLGVQKDVHLPGFVSNPYPFMKEAAVFVLSSRWEGLPGVLIEALYCGTPLVSTDCPNGPREILANGKYGQLVQVGDVQALYLAMDRMIKRTRVTPPPESWQPFEMGHVLGQYNSLFCNEVALS